MRQIPLLLGLSVLILLGCGCASTPAEAKTSGKSFTIETMGGNAVVVNNKVVPVDMLPQMLSSEGAREDDPIVIKAAPRTSYSTVEAVTRALRRASYRNVTIASKP